MRLLATSYWSFGRDRGLVREFRDVVEAAPVTLHDLAPEIDLNRTTLVFTGTPSETTDLVSLLAELAFPRIDLSRHTGAYPRTGALDEVVLTVAKDDPTDGEIGLAAATAEALATHLGADLKVPTYLCGLHGRHTDAELTRLREGGFGSLLDRDLNPDYGPQAVHPHLGITLVGARDFRLTFVAHLAGTDLSAAKGVAHTMSELRAVGDDRLLGVEADAYRLPTNSETALIVDLTLPDITPADPVIQWILEEASKVRTVLRLATLLGAIRAKDQPGAMRLVYKEQQVAW